MARSARSTPKDAPSAWQDPIQELEARRAWARAGSGAERAEREHAKGRLTARERIEHLVDPGTFLELGTLVSTPAPDARDPDLPTTFICGLAQIDGRHVAIGAEDFTIQGGGAGVHLSRYKAVFGGFLEELALDYRVPLVLLLHGVGGSVSIQERKGYPSLVSTIPSYPAFDLLDRVPVVAAVMGPAAGASGARATVSHFSLMSRPHGCLFAGGPPVVKQATGKQVDKFELGGADVHTKVSGVVDNACETEEEIFEQIRLFLSYLPRNVFELPPWSQTEDPVDRSCDELLSIVDPRPRRTYDPTALIEEVVDRHTWFEIAPDYGQSLRVGLACIGGYPVGIFASDSRFLGGAIDGPAADKQTRFADFFSTFHLPIIYFVDVPGFMIGVEAERSGVLRRGSRAVQALHRATVPVLTVQVRRSYGLAGMGTGNRKGHSIRLAWPSGSWGDMPVEGGIEAEFGAEIAAAEDPAAKRREIQEQFAAQNSMWRTVEAFGVEEVIDPRETRAVLARFVDVAFGSMLPVPACGPQMRP
jgi:acetyl-CoA carboxylase carboxyltransferase component